MKIYEIWEKIKNESQDVQDMVLSSLNGQLNVRFRQVIDKEIKNLGIVHEDLPGGVVCYYDLIFLCDESWIDLGFNKDPDLPIYRELVFTVNTIETTTEDDYGNPVDFINMDVVYKNGFPSKAVKDLLCNILDKVYVSEFIDIEDSYFVKNRD